MKNKQIDLRTISKIVYAMNRVHFKSKTGFFTMEEVRKSCIGDPMDKKTIEKVFKAFYDEMVFGNHINDDSLYCLSAPHYDNR